MLKLLAIKGSPRTNSNSSRMLELMARGIYEMAEEHELKIEEKVVEPFHMDIKACTACFSCDKTGKCVFKDDMTQLLKDYDEADIVLLASPIFFNGTPSHLKKMIDRGQPLWASKYVLEDPIIDRHKKRRSYLLGAAGAPAYKDQFTALVTVTELFFKAINAKKFGQYLYPNTDNNLIENDEEAQQDLNQAGRDILAEFI